jgi:hypothetical protein
LGISILHHRFVVGSYVRKCVTLRISKGLRAIALATGISRKVYNDTRVIFITIIAIYITLAEKIGTPLIILVLDSKVSSVSIHRFIPVDLFLFSVLPKKSHTKKFRVLSSCHRLDCIKFRFLVDGRVLVASQIFSVSCPSVFVVGFSSEFSSRSILRQIVFAESRSATSY